MVEINLPEVRKNSTNYSPENVRRIRKLRRERSVSEKHLWNAIRKEKLGFLFRTQVPIGRYALDFYCASAALCVEVDGEQHSTVRDRKRDEYLVERGIATLRIPSLDLFDPTGVPFAKWLKQIEQECKARSLARSSPPPTPSSFTNQNEEGA